MTTEFNGNIAHIVEAGHIFVIGGKTIDCASRLDICLKTGKYSDAEIPLYISVRFHEDVIARSSRLAGDESTNEETDENLHRFAINNPLIAGDDFQFYIFVGDTHFHIAINKIPFCTYAFRMAASKIRTISVTKDVQIISQIDHRAIFPNPHPIVQSDSMAAAFSNDIAKNFQAGYVIVVTGIPYGNPKGKFLLTFSEGTSGKEALHFNPRFHPEFMIVRNAMDDNLQFGIEERDGAFPFVVNEQFKLAIAFTPGAFLFAINGSYFGSFRYRSQDIFEKLNGFKMFGYKGIQLEITAVDHIIMSNMDCADFELYSKPDFDIL